MTPIAASTARPNPPAGYETRRYRGADDHAAMAAVLAAYHRSTGDPTIPTAAQLDDSYLGVDGFDADRDIVITTHGGTLIAYARTTWELVGDSRVHAVFQATQPEHSSAELYRFHVDWLERRIGEIEAALPAAAVAQRTVCRSWCAHAGQGAEPTAGEAAWLSAAGYDPVRFEALMVRPSLDDLPVRNLPAGVEIRAVTREHLPEIWSAETEAFSGQWGIVERDEASWEEFHNTPSDELALWRVAWCADVVVGQVKSFIARSENESAGRARGYTERIATHPAWRGRGIASALIVDSLRALRARGMTEAALGVDTNNPTGAMQTFAHLGFEQHSCGALFDKPLSKLCQTHL